MDNENYRMDYPSGEVLFFTYANDAAREFYSAVTGAVGPRRYTERELVERLRAGRTVSVSVGPLDAFEVGGKLGRFLP